MTTLCGLLVLVGLLGPLNDRPQPPRTAAQPDRPAVVTRGTGPAVVLLSGLLGGTARLEPLADQLLARGFRVVVIDPYHLSVNAPDVSFDGLSRAVAQALRGEEVRSAIVVAHAHAAGIALRLAANAPALVTDLVLLDAGVVASTQSAGVAGAMRIASLIARVPGGRRLIRAQLVSGIRENSGDSRWVNATVARQYADPLLEELPAVARMAARLAAAQEPEPVEHVLARVRTDVSVLLGAAPHRFGAAEEELVFLERLPGARVRRVEGVGHFVHEEAAQEVVAEVLAAQRRRAVATR